MEHIRSILGRRLRLGVIGGAPGSFIGEVHRIAARLDDTYELVCGVLSSNPQKALQAGKELGFPSDRLYKTVQQMLESEETRKDKIDALAIMTPNDTHFEYSMAALDKGFHVICDKPLTNTLEQARALVQKVRETDLVFCLTHNYTGYPLVRQAREMIVQKMLGDIRLVQVEYVQGGRAREVQVSPDMPRAWKYNPEKSGPSLVMGDIGTHAHHLLRFVTGLEVSQVSAEVGTIVPNRQVHDFAGALLRMSNGARGVFWATQAAAGVENSLSFRISGSSGSLEWCQEIPQRLQFFPLDGPAQVFTPNGPGILPAAAKVSRIAKGHPEGYLEGFANLYTEAAQAIGNAILKLPHRDYDFPGVVDGLKGLEFIEAALLSSRSGGSWVSTHQVP